VLGALLGALVLTGVGPVSAAPDPSTLSTLSTTTAPDRGLEPASPRLDWSPRGRSQPPYDPATQFVGIDGQVHTFSTLAIPGQDRYLYIGVDFDTACAFGGAIRRSMRRLAAVARIIERSGRTAVFTVAPNKAAAVEKRLPGSIPQGACGRRGLAIQNHVLDTFDSPFYVPMRQPLLTTEHAYWRTDTHWSTVGTSVLALRVAKHLDPGLAAGQRYRSTERTRLGDLEELMGGDPRPETAPARVPHNGVRTRAASGSADYDPTFQEIHPDQSWTSRPASKTYPGRTLLLGDSFTYVGLEALRNLFRRGQFLWIGTTSNDDVFDAIRRSDTVLMSVVQRFVTATPLVHKQFRAGLRQALLRR
jgi:hypothetical protein